MKFIEVRKLAAMDIALHGERLILSILGRGLETGIVWAVFGFFAGYFGGLWVDPIIESFPGGGPHGGAH